MLANRLQFDGYERNTHFNWTHWDPRNGQIETHGTEFYPTTQVVQHLNRTCVALRPSEKIGASLTVRLIYVDLSASKSTRVSHAVTVQLSVTLRALAASSGTAWLRLNFESSAASWVSCERMRSWMPLGAVSQLNELKQWLLEASRMREASKSSWVLVCCPRCTVHRASVLSAVPQLADSN